MASNRQRWFFFTANANASDFRTHQTEVGIDIRESVCKSLEEDAFVLNTSSETTDAGAQTSGVSTTRGLARNWNGVRSWRHSAEF